jgi:chloride channel 7
MNITVLTVNEEFAVSEAYTVFRTMGLRHLPVVNVANKLKGIITKKDLVEHSCKEKYPCVIKCFFFKEEWREEKG